MMSYIRVRLVAFALVFLWGCAAIGTGPRALVFTQVRGQSSEQMTADTGSCQRMAEQAPAYDQFVRPAYRNIEPQSLRVQINCMTLLGYMVFMTRGTSDQFKADMQVCATTEMKVKKALSGDDIKSIADCMLGRGYSVAT